MPSKSPHPEEARRAVSKDGGGMREMPLFHSRPLGPSRITHLMDYLFIVAGLALLVLGGEGLVRGGVGVAQRLGLSKAFIGTVLLGFGTSMPEFVATFSAAASGADGIAFGNVVGSNVANILMILGLSALIFPLALPRRGVWRDAAFVMVSSLGIVLWIWLDGLPRWGGLVLAGAFAVYMVLAFRSSGDEVDETVTFAPLGRSLLFALGGIAVLVAGAQLLITGASDVARGLGVSEAVIGITIVGVGTSLPEAVSSVIASLKRENELAFANIIGSNVFNGLAILGVSALAFPLELGGGFGMVDGIVLLVATVAMFAFAMTRNVLSRWEGAVFLASYVGYLAWLVSGVV